MDPPAFLKKMEVLDGSNYESMLSALEPTPFPPDEGEDPRAFFSSSRSHFDDICPMETLSFLKPLQSSASMDQIHILEAVSTDLFDLRQSMETGNLDRELHNSRLQPLRSNQKYTHSTIKTSDNDSSASTSKRWNERYNDLVQYRNRFGHCSVPSLWEENPPLAQWVKRQRYQLKLRKEGHHSTMSPEREEALNKLGFIWDPHTTFWEDRLRELEQFRDVYGHANVPTKFPQNPQLAIWAKCQRRQMKLYLTEGPQKSNMTRERIEKLEKIGFVFNPRGLGSKKRGSSSSSLPDLRKLSTQTVRRRSALQQQKVLNHQNDTFVSLNAQY